jgi:hypothetical protein
MPNGIYPVPPLDTHQEVGSGSRSGEHRPGAGLRLRTWWRRDRLDEQLAQGTDPNASAELALRSEQHRSEAYRIRMAKAIEATVSETRQPPALGGLLIRRRLIYECADQLIALAHRLRDAEPIGTRGAAMTSLLVSDIRSPLYLQAGISPREAVRSVRLALDELDGPSAPAASRQPPATRRRGGSGGNMSFARPNSEQIQPLDEHAERVLAAAQAFRAAADEQTSSATAGAALGHLEDALLALSAGWRDVAADAAPGIVKRRDRPPDETLRLDRGLSHERAAHLVSTLHDVAGAFAHCARTCREARSAAAPLLAERRSDPSPRLEGRVTVRHEQSAAPA